MPPLGLVLLVHRVFDDGAELFLGRVDRPLQRRPSLLGKEPDQGQAQGEIHLVDGPLAELLDRFALTGFRDKDTEADSVRRIDQQVLVSAVGHLPDPMGGVGGDPGGDILLHLTERGHQFLPGDLQGLPLFLQFDHPFLRFPQHGFGIGQWRDSIQAGMNLRGQAKHFLGLLLILPLQALQNRL